MDQENTSNTKEGIEMSAPHSQYHKFRGLGDIVAWILHKLRIRPYKTCGCQKRQETLNKLVPFRSDSKRIVDEDLKLRIETHKTYWESKFQKKSL